MAVNDPREATARIIEEIADERERQIVEEGWTREHDDQHGNGQLARAAACYAALTIPSTYLDPGSAEHIRFFAKGLWPWSWEWFKQKSKRRDLVRAGALIVAEIERLDRAEAAP